MLDAFPGDAARGGDFRTGQSTPRAEFETIHQDRWGTVYRNERVLATGVWIEEALRKPEGEVCFLESTVRDFGQMIGMVPAERFAIAQAELAEARIIIAKLEDELGQKVMVETVVKRAVDSALQEVIPPLVEPAPEPAPTTVDHNGQPRHLDEPADLPEGSAPPPSDEELAKITKRSR
jgi:hypothetical protein